MLHTTPINHSFSSTRKVKEKLIFRSAAPTYATDEDKEILLEKLNIMTLVKPSAQPVRARIVC